jgi:hypothetical protein
MMWAFFQNCWHVKDWVCNDPNVSSAQQEAACKMAYASEALVICQDLCNGTKHLKLKDPRSGAGASHNHIDLKIDPVWGIFEMDCLVDDGLGGTRPGKQLASECLAEWERILTSQGLATERLS